VSAAKPWHGFFDKLTAAEQRANAEAIELGVFAKAEFDFTQFRGAAPFTLNLDRLTEVYWQAGTALAKNIGEVRELVLRELGAGRTIIGEFGQAYWLDKRHGFSPNVTASHTFTPEFFESAGIPVQRIHTFGVAKAYDTKVGTHTFLTQMDDAHPLAPSSSRSNSAPAPAASAWSAGTTPWRRATPCATAATRTDDQQTRRAHPWRRLARRPADLHRLRGRRRPALPHVPRNEAVARRSAPSSPGIPAGARISPGVRRFGDLPRNAQRYVAAMVKSVLDVAYATAALPNLRYLGVGPQIIRDVPPRRSCRISATSASAPAARPADHPGRARDPETDNRRPPALHRPSGHRSMHQGSQNCRPVEWRDRPRCLGKRKDGLHPGPSRRLAPAQLEISGAPDPGDRMAKPRRRGRPSPLGWWKP
jgi:adenylosuccinate synthase